MFSCLSAALATACELHPERAACTDDAQCGGERCYIDDRCLPAEVIAHLGGSVGEECTSGDACAKAGARCRMGRCEDGPVSVADCVEGDEAPFFGGLLEALPDGADAVALRWAAAVDDTPAADIAYLVFVSPVSGHFDLTRPKAVLRGERAYRMTGLTTARTYYFLVRARDIDGNVDCNLVERSATPLELGACIDYATLVQPLFSARCTACHSGPFASQGLRLDSHAGVMAGGTGGPAVSACEPEQSLLYDKVASEAPTQGDRMPLYGPYLSSGQLELLRLWIDQGARADCAGPDVCSP